ncbi:MAG: DinB family protein [Lunatimonas sp.]|uniref:DinB family protein n=1 Tax=Lunatimonas sp. TaxID=2060141 RepID=UPI00263B1E99|nr:DinB family protein [Lunatimonas sp.]MCC5937765.1 DinB family protein [Lunatimonas sp.]
MEEIVRNWERAKAYTKEYLDTMPETSYSLKPTPQIRSFADQMLHLADGNFSFAALAADVTCPVGFGECEQSKDKSKSTVTKWVLDSYDFVIEQLRNMESSDLNEVTTLFGRYKMSRRAVFDTLYEHQTHHRGQTTIYLRLAGVVPPGQKLF